MRGLLSILPTILGAAIFGCGARVVVDGAGGAEAGTGGTGSGGGGGVGSTCTQMAGNCGACTSCALAGPCASLYSACENDSDCTTIDVCFEGCNGNSACEQTCFANNPSGAHDYQSLLECVDCAECPTACPGLCM
jgi:hypothetical protein